MEVPPRVRLTRAAAEQLAQLQQRTGPVMFHQSGGCCDGSSPMCYPDGDFVVGDRDVLLGLLDVTCEPQPEGVPVWISGPQFDVWKHTQLVIDLVAGRGSGFSLEAPDGVRFLSRGRAFTADETAQLEHLPAITGAQFEQGVRPPGPRGDVVAHAADACPIPNR
ncbi:DUF779 domain-containing protein [Mycobacterium sp. ACS4331]|uniref:DUF779 domain-containing protein n=1 Tax=Mycobacterium sp. ACS4331 TaxID=1834121 RepID=UPI0007FBADD6|nr:DUF779 domain-containing protein [Mycobacterium sp. ACS4331]OBF28720.1 hypothetical protein A5727_25190 [Mycobacterium sp. ACS4331]